ncbi:hypothetical protein T08_15805 [Trichinella sp. T8]|nr:hypothetical protein T08_15805 [Trichinella sp. T8]
MPIKSIFRRKGKYRDLCNWGRRKYVCCTYLIIFYQLISIKPIFRGKSFSQQLQNFMGYIDLLCMINGENSLIKIWAFLIHNHSQLLLIMVLKLFVGFHGVSRKLQISWAIDWVIFTTHLIASASAERSFNAVKYLKSYFWTTMTEERLNGLATTLKLCCSQAGYHQLD